MKTITHAIEKPYSKEDIKRIGKVFAELREASKDKTIREYLKKTRKELMG